MTQNIVTWLLYYTEKLLSVVQRTTEFTGQLALEGSSQNNLKCYFKVCWSRKKISQSFQVHRMQSLLILRILSHLSPLWCTHDHFLLLYSLNRQFEVFSRER